MSYMFVTVAPGKMKDVHKKLLEREDIDFVLPISGAYDIVAKLNAEFGDELHDLSDSVSQMQNVDGVKIMPSFKSKSNDTDITDSEYCSWTAIRANRSSEDLMDKISNLKGVAEVSTIAGDWNLMACLCGDDVEALDMTALDIRKLEGIKATESYIAFPQSLTEDVIGPTRLKR